MGTSLSIAIVGRNGQLAQALASEAQRRGIATAIAGRSDIDLQSSASIASFLARARAGVIVNAAAYTAVDRAESEPEAAFLLNAAAPARLAQAASAASIPLIHISTDYVFDGAKAGPYSEDDACRPLGLYGCSKAAGEAAVRALLPRHLIIRTSWVYAATGQNFVRTMLRLGTERDTVRVVADQVGAPTNAGDLAGALLDMAARICNSDGATLYGTYHLTGGGETTWHGFAAEIFRIAAAHGHPIPKLEAITTACYPTPARRPANSRLSMAKAETHFGIEMPCWQTSLARAMADILATRTVPEPST